jgi:hypothetical protein
VDLNQPPEAPGPRVILDRLDMLQAFDADGRDAGSAVRMPLTDKWVISNSHNDDLGDTYGEDRAREILWQMANGGKPARSKHHGMSSGGTM